jgi:thiol-disulfide isomerase/thioredoxin
MAVNTIEYTSFLRDYNNLYRIGISYFENSSADTTRFVNFLKEKGLNVTPKEEQLVKWYQVSHASAIKPAVTSFFKKYDRERKDFAISYLLYYQLLDSIIGHVQPGIGRDILIARLISQPLENYNIVYTTAELKRRISNINSEQLKAALIQQNETVKGKLAATMSGKSVIRTALRVSQDKLFSALIKPYKGKVIYIDFWAPWCGPCMGEMPYAKEIKRDLANREVVFLYIGVRCTKEWWQNTIKAKTIEGEHYYASDDEYKLLSAKFNISGIPHFVLVNKQGEVVNDAAPRPSNKQNLLQAMNKLLTIE